MHIPLLIVGGNELDRRQQADRQVASYTVSSFDLHRITPNEAKKSIGISQIKSLIRELLYSPVQGREKIGIIYELHHATVEAQNALLKLLEEPNETTILIATATRKEEVLPTIVSRCRIVTVQNEDEYVPTQEELNQLDTILKASEGDRMSYAEEIVKADTAKEWINTIIRTLRYTLITEYLQPTTYNLQLLINAIRTLDRAHITLEKTNTNQRLLMENLLLSLDQMPFQ